MLSWPQRAAVVSGNAFEFYDIAVYAAISPYLAHILTNNGIAHSNYIVWGIFALRFLIRPLGGIFVGKIADQKGRKSALIFTSSLTGIATLLMAIMPVNQLGDIVVVLFLLLQMMQAFSFGGEYPTIIQYLHQESRANEHARISSFIVASSIVGVIASLGIVTLLKGSLSVSEMQEYGWRIPLAIGAINILMSFWFRLRLPVSEMKDTLAKKRKPSYAKVTSKVFFISATGAVIFYVQNLSSSILAKSLSITHFGLINSTLLLALILIVGWATDKLSFPRRSFKVGLLVGLVTLYPSYHLLSTHASLSIQWSALVFISFISALILANLAAVLFDIAEGNTTSLALGYNIALSIFGGLSPLIVAYLSGIDISYVGIYASLAVIPAIIGFRISTIQSQPEKALSSATQ